MTGPTPRARAEAWWAEGVAAVEGGAAVSRVLTRAADGTVRIEGRSLPSGGGFVVAAIGKAAASMARAAERILGDRLRGGRVLTKDGHGVPLERLVLREAAHPVPDERGAAAAQEILALAAEMAPGDVFLLLLSGGASALSACPAEGLTGEDVASVTGGLLSAGVDIAAMNTVRKHLSGFSGGRLAVACRAVRIEVLAISDVPGDALETLGSGPCSADPSTFADACDILQGAGLWESLPARVVRHLDEGRAGRVPESPKPGDPALARVSSTIVASNAEARRAVMEAARRDGVEAIDLGGVLRGEARDAGQELAERWQALGSGASVCLVGGGETTVTLRGEGRGGRSQEVALAAAIALDGRGRAAEGGLLVAGTDGSDGPTDAAGAWADPETLARGRVLGLDPEDHLRRNDAYTYFDREGGLLRTGPTHTNVMDLVLGVRGLAASGPPARGASRGPGHSGDPS